MAEQQTAENVKEGVMDSSRAKTVLGTFLFNVALVILQMAGVDLTDAQMSMLQETSISLAGVFVLARSYRNTSTTS